MGATRYTRSIVDGVLYLPSTLHKLESLKGKESDEVEHALEALQLKGLKTTPANGVHRLRYVSKKVNMDIVVHARNGYANMVVKAVTMKNKPRKKSSGNQAQT